MLSPIILRYLPILFLIVFIFLGGRRNRLRPIPYPIVLLFVVTIVLALSVFPEELNPDKPRYRSMYLWTLRDSGANLDYKDIGWALYVFLCGRIIGNNIDLYFLLTAAIYISGYYHFANRFFPQKTIGYFLVFAAGCLGFTAYGVNTIRAGVALSLLLHSVSLYDRKGIRWRIFALFVAFLSVMAHKSMIIPLSAFLLSVYIKNIKISILSWGACFFLSLVNFDLSELFEYVGFVDERIGSYIEGAEMVSSYQSGFRIDFIIYSLIPLSILYFYYKVKLNIVDDFTSRLIRMYLYANAVWLLAIRVHYSDRLAYLSWFLIPIILLLPICKNQKQVTNPQNVVLVIMLIFMSLPIVLSLRG